MKYCMFCGAELNDDDVFCFKCGASQTAQPNAFENNADIGAGQADGGMYGQGQADGGMYGQGQADSGMYGQGQAPGNNVQAAASDAKVKKPFFKRPIGIIVIVLALVLIVGAVGFVIAINNPKVMLALAVKNTASDMQNIPAVKFLKSVGENGSVTATVNAEDLLGSYGVDLDGEIVYKEYFDAGSSSTAATLELKSHDASLADVTGWMTPEAVVLSSEVLLGDDAYGIGIKTLQTTLANSDFEDKIPDDIVDAIEEMDPRLLENPEKCKDILADYGKDIATYLGERVIEYAGFEKSKDEVSFNSSRVNADVITVTFDESDLQKALEDTLVYASTDEKFSEARNLIATIIEFYQITEGDIDPDGEEELEDAFDEIEDAIEDITDFRIQADFYVKNLRLVKVALEEKESNAELSFTIGPDPKDPEIIEVKAGAAGIDYRIGYKVKSNTSSEYKSKMYVKGPFSDESVEFTWDKKEGDCSFKYGDAFTFKGIMTKSGNEVEIVFDKMEVYGQKKRLDGSVVLKSSDSMPKVPKYIEVLEMDEDDVEDLIDEIEDNIDDLSDELE